jgi:hypothetical protein
MDKPLVPITSNLRRIPTAVDQRTILFLDGIRYSLEIADLTFNRLGQTVLEFDRDDHNGKPLGSLIVSLMTDAWMFIDCVHRLRELLQQTPRIKQNDPELQLFLRRTSAIEQLRHFVQHLRSGIEAFVQRNMPLWGTLSWGNVAIKDGQLVCHIVIPGTYYTGVWARGVTVDLQEHRFCERIVLMAGGFRVDLAEVFDQVTALAEWYTAWFERTFNDDPRHGSDVHHTVFVAQNVG